MLSHLFHWTAHMLPPYAAAPRTFAPQWWLLNPEDWLSHYFQLCKGVPCSLAVLGLRMSTQAFWTVPKRMSLRVTLVRQINWFHTALAHGRWAASEYSTQLQTFSLSASLSHVESEGNEGGSVAKWWHDNTTVQWCTKYVRNMYEVHHPSARAMQLHYEFAEDYGSAAGPVPGSAKPSTPWWSFEGILDASQESLLRSSCEPPDQVVLRDAASKLHEHHRLVCLRWICIMFIFFPTNIDKCDVFAYFCYSSVSFLPCKTWGEFLSFQVVASSKAALFSTGASFLAWRQLKNSTMKSKVRSSCPQNQRTHTQHSFGKNDKNGGHKQPRDK